VGIARTRIRITPILEREDKKMEVDMESDVNDEFVKEEYLHLQNVIENFDQKSLTIKSWSVTVSMAGIVSAFTQKNPYILLLSAGASLLFWIIEGLWKSFQHAHYPRVKDIEQYYKSGKSAVGFSAPDITNSWTDNWNKGKGKLLRLLWYPHILLPHVLVTLAGIVLWLINLKLSFISPG
jgi:hypothetical protein